VTVAPLLAAVDDITREAARRAAEQELREQAYRDAQPPLLTRVVGRAVRAFLELLDRAAGNVPGGRLGLLLLVLLLALLTGLVLVRLGPVGRRTAAPALFGGGTLTAGEHRLRAEQAAAAGAWADAVRERLRAVVRELEVRGVLEPRPGRTADEVAAEGGAAVPAIAAPLRRGATVFDEIWYGGRTADAASSAALVEVDRAVATARLVLA
jgi:hypothetical protein